MRKQKINRLLAGFMASIMLANQIPAFALAEETGLCEHHPIHSDCGYVQGVSGSACAHDHTKECFVSTIVCVHEHGECSYIAEIPGTDCKHIHNLGCGYIASAEENSCNHIHDDFCGYGGDDIESVCSHTHDDNCEYQPEIVGCPCTHIHDELCDFSQGSSGTPCDHVCSEITGCITQRISCTHNHDDFCGYVESAESHVCDFVCTACANNSSESVCTCGSTDAIHDTVCPMYVVPDNPSCTCAEKCTAEAINTWCDICSIQGVTLCAGNDMAITFEGDNGPYPISSKAELNAIRTNLSGSYYLTQNIVFNESDYLEGGMFYNDGNGWEPIGTEEDRFSGVLDGCGYAIVGLRVSGKDYAGLFSYMSGTVKNLTLKDTFVSGLWSSGAIAAVAMESATVTNCILYGTVVANSNQWQPAAGGFVGKCYENWKVPGGTIRFENCHNYANVDATSTSSTDAHSGGIYGLGDSIGSLLVKVIRCSNHGNITGTDRVGGIVGISADKGEIIECYNTGAITSGKQYDYVGGICGIADGYSSSSAKIVNCYNAGTITATSYAGGIAGGYHEVTIEGCYNVGTLHGMDKCGIGKDSTTGSDQVLLNNYTISPYMLIFKDGWPVYTNYPDSELQQQETYQGFDFEHTWFIDRNIDYPYPQLSDNVQNSIMDISVETQPDCAVFIEGRKPDLTGATAKITYKSGVTAIIDITERMLWDIDCGRVGTQEVHVYYAGIMSENTLVFDVTSKDIELTSLPDKLVYLEGKDELDVSGAELTITYGDGSSEIITVTESMVSGFDNTVVGIQTLSVAYEEKMVTFEIEVKAKNLIEIRVPVLPLKLTYVQGQPIDPDGGVLELIYDNDTVERKALTLALLTVSSETLGETPVTVSYGGQETTFTVCVKPQVVKSVVITLPEKREYTVGENLDLTGGMIIVTFESDDDYTDTIPLDISMVSGYDSNTPSRQTLQVTYLEYTKNFDVFVHEGGHEIVVAVDQYPESNHPYEKGMDETTTFTYEGAKSLTITFSSNTRLDNAFDIIYIYDGAGNKIVEYRRDDAANRVLEIPGDTFAIRLTSNSSATGYGYAFSCIVAHMDILHPPVVDVATATCTQSGLSEGSHCAVCGKVLVAQEFVDGLGHTELIDEAVAATCTVTGLTEGKHCSVCKEVLTKQEVVPALGHTEVIDKAVAPDCENTGLTEGKHCSVCDKVIVAQEVIPAKGHTEVIDKAAEAGCEDTGLTEGKHCSVCDKVIVAQEVIPAKGHTEVIDKGSEAGCEDTGLTEGKHCSVCEIVLMEQESIPAIGHEWSEWEVSKPATSAEMGEEVRFCAVCGAEETQSIDKLSNPFEDVAPEKFYAKPVMWAVENGVTNGVDDTHYAPDKNCTRAQVVTFLWRAAGSPEPTSTNNPFVDVIEGKFYYKAVLWAVENGITNGVDATHFGTNDECTRGHVATFLWRTLGKPAASGTNPFGDVADGKFYYDAVLWAAESGVTTGVSAGKFDPNGTCTRGQIVTFLYRALG